MRFHIQNLNERGKYQAGSMLRHGRWWLHLGKRASLHCEWSWFTHFFGITVDIGTHDDTAVGVHIACCLFSVWLSLDYWELHNWLAHKTRRTEDKYGSGRTFGVQVHDSTVWFEFYNDPMCWSSQDPKWQHFNFHPMDFFFGRQKYSERDLETVRVEVPMPEGAYPATVRMMESRWSRPRWPFAKKLIRADVTPDEPIPFPGKGENSWDCGEDATHSMTCAAETPFKAAMNLSESVMRDRVRRGGQHWRPAKARV